MKNTIQISRIVALLFTLLLSQLSYGQAKLNNATIKGAADDGFNLTFVKSTGVAWLDVTISKDHTTPQIKARMADPNDDLYGFRHATDDEVEALMKSYGLPNLGAVTGDEHALSFMEDFGYLGNNTADGPVISPVWAVEGDPDQYKKIIAETENNKSSVGQGGWDPDWKASHFLVFDSPMIPHNDSSFKTSPSSENNMTFDSRTGFSWLDVALTYNYSIQEIVERINDSNDELYGFQYAVYDDVEKMLAEYGIPLNGGEVPGTSKGFSFIKDFDKIRSGNRTTIGPSNGGIFYARADLGQSIQVIAHTTDDENGEVTTATTSGRSSTEKYPHDGHFLYKTNQ